MHFRVVRAGYTRHPLINAQSLPFATSDAETTAETAFRPTEENRPEAATLRPAKSNSTPKGAMPHTEVKPSAPRLPEAAAPRATPSEQPPSPAPAVEPPAVQAPKAEGPPPHPEASAEGSDADDTFKSLGLQTSILETLNALSYEHPTPIQAQAIPALISGRDVLGQAATGTGKTAAFALPALERIAPNPGRAQSAPRALVLVPTRELAMQVAEAFVKYGRGLGIRTLAVYGGQPIGRQLRELDKGAHVVVATPGRALDHLRRRSMSLDAVELLVLDEADEMLDMGFAEDLDAILSATPAERQTALFSATLPPRIDAIAKRHLTKPVRLKIAAPTGASEQERVRETAYIVARKHKAPALARILTLEAPRAALVFCQTREDVDQLQVTLSGRGFRPEALHGGMDQEQRDRVMGRFRDGTTTLLLATDVAARGLDIDHLSHVINIDAPASRESYVHRIGRVGRAGREGVAITLAEPRDRRQLENIERLTKRPIAVQRVPSPKAVAAWRLKNTVQAVKDIDLEAPEELERLTAAVTALAEETNMMQVAIAALKLANSKGATRDDLLEIPDLSTEVSRPKKRKAPGRSNAPGSARDRVRPESGSGARSESRDHSRPNKPARKGRKPDSSIARLFVGAGSRGGVRPADLVGAIASESPLRREEIGAIDISLHFSLVEVPAARVDDVIKAMAKTNIRGKKARIRRFVEE